MTQNKSTTTLAVIVVIASLMVGATVAIALMSEGIGLQQANALVVHLRKHCNEHSLGGSTAYPPCSGG
jgi:hypothetical protein